MGYKQGAYNIPVQNDRDIVKFINELKAYPWFEMSGNIEPHWKMFYGKTWGAARGAAGDAAWGAARDAAWGAARGAARGAAWGAAWGAARGAAGDAALYASLLVVQDLPGIKKHLAYMKKRMQVWKHGYGLFADINGTFYVYGKR